MTVSFIDIIRTKRIPITSEYAGKNDKDEHMFSFTHLPPIYEYTVLFLGFIPIFKYRLIRKNRINYLHCR